MAVRIYTKGGDKGQTSIHGGERVDKDDIRIEAIGSLDELNSMIGIVRSFLDDNDERHEILFQIQYQMMIVMSLVATPSHIIDHNPNHFDGEFIKTIESYIDDVVNRMPDNDYFILPGGTKLSAHLQYTRTIVRRAERILISLNRIDSIQNEILIFINRLSDLFFVMGRYEMLISGKEEERWKKFLYKKKKGK